jgi:NAD-dependent deacetylase
MDDLIKKAAADLSEAKMAAALTGAGISTESGIPPFRGKGGLWEKYDPMEVAHIDAFLQDPAKVWNLLFKDMKDVLDKDVIEFHGNMAWQRCTECSTHYKTSRVEITEIPPRCDCGGILRPNAVLFGEMIPQEALWRSRQVATDCDVMLVIGTSAVVQPAALMPVVAKESGAKVIEINPERTPLTGDISDYLIMGTAGDVMNRIMADLENMI